MRLYLVIDETPFFHPSFLADFLARTPDEIVGCAVVTHVPARHNIDAYVRRHWYYLRLSEMLKLAAISYARRFLDLIPWTYRFLNLSVRSVLKRAHIGFIEVQGNINRPEYLDEIRSAQPDVIVSSNSLIFGSELLRIPKICCVNRHSALLPAYGGLWPVFQAYRCNEQHVGVSVHVMDQKIDRGLVLAQHKIPVEETDTLFDLYRKCFAVSSDVLLQALDKVRDQNLTACETGQAHSYFSFPTKEHWAEFRARGGRFI